MHLDLAAAAVADDDTPPQPQPPSLFLAVEKQNSPDVLCKVLLREVCPKIEEKLCSLKDRFGEKIGTILNHVPGEEAVNLKEDIGITGHYYFNDFIKEEFHYHI